MILALENKLNSLNTKNKEYTQFIDELIIKYPYATFLHILLLKKIEKLDLVLNKKEINAIYNLFTKNKVDYILTYLNNLNNEKLNLSNSQRTSVSTTKGLNFSTNKIDSFLNELSLDEIPYLLETLINKYHKETSLHQLSFVYNKEETETEQEIDLNKKMSFKQWANVSSRIQKNAIKNNKETDQQFIIDRFLKENPKISRPSKNFEEKNLEFNSLEIYSTMTETLAEIYLDQHKYEKAINAYEILSLKFPEKNLYFAEKINQINKLI